MSESIAASFDALPDELLANVLSHIRASCLHRFELVNKRWRSAIVNHRLWWGLCTEAFPVLRNVAETIDVDDGSRESVHAHLPLLQHRLAKKLCWRLGAASEKLSLVADAIEASSMDRTEEDLANTLLPYRRACIAQNTVYWSTAGSDDANVVDWGSYVLAHPLCVIHSFHIRPFKAYFQPGNPIYSWKSVRLEYGGTNCFDNNGRRLPVTQIVEQCAVDRERTAAHSVHSMPSTSPTAHNSSSTHNQPPGNPITADSVTAHLTSPRSAVGSSTVGTNPNGAATSSAAANPNANPNAVQNPIGTHSLSTGSVRQGLRSVSGSDDISADVSKRKRSKSDHDGVSGATENFQMKQEDELQAFELSNPVLCCGGMIRAVMRERVQQQHSDDRYYGCICYFHVRGAVVRNFVFLPPTQHGGTARLKYVEFDPMEASGGLSAVSERGRSMEASEAGTWPAPFHSLHALAQMQMMFGQLEGDVVSLTSIDPENDDNFHNGYGSDYSFWGSD